MFLACGAGCSHSEPRVILPLLYSTRFRVKYKAQERGLGCGNAGMEGFDLVNREPILVFNNNYQRQ